MNRMSLNYKHSIFFVKSVISTKVFSVSIFQKKKQVADVPGCIFVAHMAMLFKIMKFHQHTPTQPPLFVKHDGNVIAQRCATS